VRVGRGTFCILSHAPLEDHPFDARREPSALEGWILEVLCRDPKGRRVFMRILSTEGPSVRPSTRWAICSRGESGHSV